MRVKKKTLIRGTEKSQLEGLIELGNSFNKKKKIKKIMVKLAKKIKQQRILLNDEIERKKDWNKKPNI